MMWPKLLLFCIAFALLAGALAEALLVPNSPGCWIKYPSGCPNQKHRAKYDNLQDPTIWNLENFNGASESQDKCIARKSPINNWCGVSDVIIQYRSGASVCPSSCKCKSGQHAVDKSGNCNYWCSKYGYCGETEAHKNGVDCRGCAVQFQLSGECPELPPLPECRDDEHFCATPDRFGCPTGGFCMPNMMDNGEFCSSQDCPIMCNPDETFCSGAWDGLGCKELDFCLPPAGDDCPVHCPASCSEDNGEVLCPGMIEYDGCQGPDKCLPVPMNIDGEPCPASSVCPTTCGPEEFWCPGDFDDLGCHNPDMCIWRTTGMNGEFCPENCPVMCAPNEAFCSGGMDENGCQYPDMCIPRMMSVTGELCPEACPTICGPKEAFCPGGMDENWCPTPDMCMEVTTDINGELCPDVCPITCRPEETFCPGGIDCLGCMMADTCTLGECPEPVECLAG